MRQIGSIEDENHAIRFSDYLLASGVPNMVEEGASGGSWSVWIENDDHLDRGRAELDAFRRNPTDPRYDKAGKAAEAVRQAEAKKQQRMRDRFVDVRTRWGQPKQWAAPLTMALLAISVLVGIATLAGSREYPVLDWLRWTSKPLAFMDRDYSALESGAWHPLDDIRRGQVWRVVTPIFVHYGPIHLLFNMFMLFQLGMMIETRRGTGMILALVATAAIVGNTAQYVWTEVRDPYFPPLPFFGGMSGVVYALFGYAWMRGRFDPQGGVGVSQQTVVILLVWLALGMLNVIPNIANAAHVGGLLVGVAFGYLPHGWRKLRRRMAA